MPWAISAAGPIFSGSSSYSTAACVTSSSGQLSSSRLFIVHQRPGRMVNSQVYLATSPRQDKILTMELLVSDLLLCAPGQIAGWHSPSLPPSRAYFSFTSCQPAFSGQRRSWRTFKYKADYDDGAPWRRVLGGAGTVIRVGALCHRWVSDPSQPARYVTPIPPIDPPTATR